MLNLKRLEQYNLIKSILIILRYLLYTTIAYSFKHNDNNNIILDYKNVSITENRLRYKLKNVESKQLYFSKRPITETVQ